jgi:predicted kinase
MKAYITIGLPASGKSTWAKEFCDKNSNTDNVVIRVNNDDIRNAIYAEQGHRNWSPKLETLVRTTKEMRISTRAMARHDVVIDNTHLSPKTLKEMISFCEGLGYVVELVDFRHVSLEECIRRDSLREGHNQVGEKVIRNMYNQFMKEPVDRDLPAWIPNKLPDCIIVDIDGTLAQMKNRGPYEETKVYQDDVRQHVLFTILSMMNSNPELKVFVFSGRSEKALIPTVRWMNDKCGLGVAKYSTSVVFDKEVELYMRKEGDRRRDSLVKKELFDLYVKDKYNVIVVFDDRPQVIRECWKELNFPVFQCGLIDVEF